MSASTEVVAFNSAWRQSEAVIRARLPKHIDFEAFSLVAHVAVQRQPKLLISNRERLFLAFQDCAASGLMPDGKEGAIVLRWDNESRSEAAVWQPMVGGILKLARQANIKSFTAQIVFKGEPFRIVLGDDERYEHERKIECWSSDIEDMVLAYGIAVLSDGTVIRRHMPKSKILAVRQAVAFKQDGSPKRIPWNGPHWDEMVVKTMLRFLSKWLPLSSSDEREKRLLDALDADPDTMAYDPSHEAPKSTTAQLSAPSKLDGLEAALGLNGAVRDAVTADLPVDGEPAETVASDTKPARDPKMLQWTIEMEALFAAVPTRALLFKRIDGIVANREWLKSAAPELDARIDAAVRAASLRLTAPDVEPIDELEVTGEAHAAG